MLYMLWLSKGFFVFINKIQIWEKVKNNNKFIFKIYAIMINCSLPLSAKIFDPFEIPILWFWGKELTSSLFYVRNIIKNSSWVKVCHWPKKVEIGWCQAGCGSNFTPSNSSSFCSVLLKVWGLAFSCWNNTWFLLTNERYFSFKTVYIRPNCSQHNSEFIALASGTSWKWRAPS